MNAERPPDAAPTHPSLPDSIPTVSAELNPTTAGTVPTEPLPIPAERQRTTACPNCQAPVGVKDRYCEECGQEIGARRVALPRPVDEAGTPAGPSSCESCGGQDHDSDGYCRGCGQLRTQPDRFEADLGAVYVATDRGLSHARNEDSVAAAVIDGPGGIPGTTVIVVSDGVSSSEDPQAASGAAVRAGVDGCLSALADGDSPEEAVYAGLLAAIEAVRATAKPNGHAPSCTYVSAIVRGYGTGEFEIAHANIGDSRAYWLRTESSASVCRPSQKLTKDDSYAQTLVDLGTDEATAMQHPRAHHLMRWLGADSGAEPTADSCVGTFTTTGPGVLLLCSDGLWNYRPGANDLAVIATAAERMPAARELVEFALRSGGRDNITVALAPIT
ncbi:protein phosphatase 2C domain-containing protein [Nocardia sp. XZ_19_385]|uniref:protein phosphatase 2C domain-containing protein n=1 Tax=Nocardia sp. XZ_19_385 TaxID=2769488 RepID=UPI00188E80FB|nr:protein phosphatase 2C domain-containing protein [Nocardia sp. XZ_19_385]